MSFVLCALMAVTSPAAEEATYTGTPSDVATASQIVVIPELSLRQWRTRVAETVRAQVLASDAEKLEATYKLLVVHEQLRQSMSRRTKLSGADVRVMGKTMANRLLRAQKEFQPAEAKPIDGLAPQLGGNEILAQFARNGAFQGLGQNQPGGNRQDLEQALCDLIQATVDPDTWEPVGGPGVIRAWSPFRRVR